MKKIGNQGVSLVELLIVIAIIVILAVIVGVNFVRQRDNQNLRSAALEIEGDITETRTRALSRNRVHRITFNVGAPTYTIEECAVAGTTNCAAYNQITLKNLSTLVANGLIISNANNGAFTRFQMRGTSDPITVVITNPRGSTATITTNITGRAYVTYNY